MKLRPVDFSTDGVFMAGLAHSPKNTEEVIAQAKAAAGRAGVALSKEMAEYYLVSIEFYCEKAKEFPELIDEIKQMEQQEVYCEIKDYYKKIIKKKMSISGLTNYILGGLYPDGSEKDLILTRRFSSSFFNSSVLERSVPNIDSTDIGGLCLGRGSGGNLIFLRRLASSFFSSSIF